MKTLADEVGGPKRIIGGPFGSKLTTKDYTAVGVPVIRGSNMEYDGRWIGGDFAYVSTEKFKKDLSTNSARPGSIIVTQRGTLGQVSIIPDDSAVQVYVVSQSQMAIEIDPEKVCRNFVYYYLRSPQFVEHSERQTIQTGVPHINLRILRDAPALFPPLTEQREIAGVLGLLDDKIELNRKTAATLEEMARALYRSWFVDFDPVRARAEGRPPAHMDAATAALFPESFGADGLPVGWVNGVVSDVFDVTMGQSPPGDTYNNAAIGLPFYQGRSEFGFRFPGLKNYCSSPTRIARADSILVSVRAPVGDLNRAWEECCIGRGVAALWEKSSRHAYGYEAMQSLSSALAAFDSEGTVFGSINKKQLAALPLIIPNAEIVDSFERLVSPLDSNIRTLTAQNRSLVTLRDTLLPRLMSGELRVGAARELIEEVA